MEEYNGMLGFMIDDEYFVEIPREGEFIFENEDGTGTVLVNVYKVKENNFEKVMNDDVTEEIANKIETAIHSMLEAAIAHAIGSGDIDEGDDYETIVVEEDTSNND